MTLPSQTAAELVVARVRAGARPSDHRPGGHPRRSATAARTGRPACHRPRLEGGLEIVRHTLVRAPVPDRRLQPFVDAVRRDAYQGRFDGDGEARARVRSTSCSLPCGGRHRLAHAAPGQPPRRIDARLDELRRLTGTSFVAIMQHGELVANPSPATVSATATCSASSVPPAKSPPPRSSSRARRKPLPSRAHRRALSVRSFRTVAERGQGARLDLRDNTGYHLG